MCGQPQPVWGVKTPTPLGMSNTGAYYGDLGVLLLAGSRGRALGQGQEGEAAPLKLKAF